MDREYKIHPLLISMVTIDKGSITYLSSYGEKVSIPIYSWYIEGSDKHILVDAGIGFADFERYSPIVRGFGGGGKDVASLEENLGKFGLKPLDIDIVVITHMHLDHFFNARDCRNARIIVQKDEIDWAHDPHPLFAGSFHKELYEGFNLQLVDGDFEIAPGIEVVCTPGHTPGSQSVSVATKSGKAVIAGFCSDESNFGDKVLVPGIHVDPLEAYDSIIRIKKIADIIVPSHGQKFQDGKYIG
jgi:glyoxylase-like metal-dependent hydrolase (beta-lactamase superfamily II)